MKHRIRRSDHLILFQGENGDNGGDKTFEVIIVKILILYFGL